MSDYALWNLVNEAETDRLIDELRADGMALRQFDTAGVTSREGLWSTVGDAFGVDDVQGWDSFADQLWMALLPDDDEGDRVAVIWRHADALLAADLGVFLEALDILTTTGRQAYSQGLTVLSFLLGAGSNFPPLPT